MGLEEKEASDAGIRALCDPVSGPAGVPVVRLGMPLVDDYLEFLAGRCRPNTVLAAAYDLKVFFAVVGKPAARSARPTCWGSSPPSAPAAPIS